MKIYAELYQQCKKVQNYRIKSLQDNKLTPKQIGYGMGLIFDSFKGFPEDKNIICLAHYEEYKDKNGDSISYKFKTTGKMVGQSSAIIYLIAGTPLEPFKLQSNW